MALGAIFALGFLVCITGVMRFYYLFVMYYRTYDVTCKCFLLLVYFFNEKGECVCEREERDVSKRERESREVVGLRM